MDQKNDPKTDAMLTSIGAFAEMTYAFYKDMINAGAASRVAMAAMKSYVAAYWHEAMESSRENRREGNT